MSVTTEILRVVATVQDHVLDRTIRVALGELGSDLYAVRDRLDAVAAGQSEGLAVELGAIEISAELVLIRRAAALGAIPRLDPEVAFDLIASAIDLIEALRRDDPEPFRAELMAWLAEKCVDTHVAICERWRRGGFLRDIAPAAPVVSPSVVLN